MKVLFVDDDEFVLNGIKRALFKMGWQTKFATSGERALVILSEFSADFIVSDARMPGMNGVELLKQASATYPSTVRIILSGHADSDMSTQASYVAHQWFNKPCDTEVLCTELQRIYDVKCKLPYEKLQHSLSGLRSLPSVPRTFLKIKSLLGDDSVTMKDVSKLICEDASLVAKILQVANSSFFVTGAKVTKIDDAIIRLGVDVVCNIVAVAEIYANVDDGPAGYFEEILDRALKTARLASLIADKSEQDVAMLAGILHNLGELVLCQIAPQNTEKYLQERVLGADNLTLEKQLFGVDSIQITSFLLHLWHFPYSLIECITLQHDVNKLVTMDLGSAVSVYLARMTINKLEIAPEIIDKFDISEQIDKWRDMEGD